MGARTRSTPNGRAGAQRAGGVPLLTARRGSMPERFAERMRGRHPAAVFFTAVFAGFAVLAAVSIALGLFMTDVLLHAGGVASKDEHVVESLVSGRTPLLTDVSAVGSAIGGAPVLPILVGLSAIVCALRRRWLIAGFAVFVLALESATYRVTTLAVPRERPAVHRLEELPVDASFPSGHTAASIAVYVGLVLLITSRVTTRGVRLAAWAIALLLPVFVALSRMYRGMHHPLDVAGGMVIGIGALLVLLFACRAAGVAGEVRSARPAASTATPRRPQPVT